MTNMSPTNTIHIEFQSAGNYDYTCHNPECWYCEMMSYKKPKDVLVKTTSHMETVKKNWDVLALQDIARLINMSKSHCSKLGKLLGLPNKRRIKPKHVYAKRTDKKSYNSTSWW